jgi:hypothetical protein
MTYIVIPSIPSGGGRAVSFGVQQGARLTFVDY